MINAGLLVDLPHVDEAGAEGIGLFRTELEFMVASTLPRQKQQTALYRTVLDAVDGKPVTFRTLDIGGDKVLPYLRVAEEENPALGWRAIRLGLDRPGLLRIQIRSLLHAAAGRELRIMLPMITEVAELVRARKVIDRELAHFERHGHAAPKKLMVGAMVEVPALFWQLDELMAVSDFVSVGTNDLAQFIMASDRGNLRVAGRFDPLSAPFLRVLRQVVRAAERAGVPVTICGELAGQPLAAMALIGLGYRSLSMAPAAIGPVKAMTLELEVGELAPFLDELLDQPAMENRVHGALLAFAERNAIPI
jgi:phosphotransferase system enzyme I (PtsP)